MGPGRAQRAGARHRRRRSPTPTTRSSPRTASPTARRPRCTPAPVRAAAARRLTDVVIGARPDLVGAATAGDERGARAVVGTPRSARWCAPRRSTSTARSSSAARRGLTLQVLDAGVLVAESSQRLAPRAADRMPTRVITRVARIHGGVHGFMLRIAEHADRARPAKWIALAAALVLALGALVVTDSRRASVLRLGVACAGVGVAVAAGGGLAPALAGRQRRPGRPRGGARRARRVAGPAHGVGAGRGGRRARGRARGRRRSCARSPSCRCCAGPVGGRDPAAQPAERVLRARGGDRRGRRDGAVAARRARGGDRGGRGAARPRRDEPSCWRWPPGRPSPRHGCAVRSPGAARASEWWRSWSGGAVAVAARSRAATARPSRGSGAATATRRCATAARPGRLRRHPQLDGGRRRARVALRRAGRRDRPAAARRRPRAADRHALRVRDAARRRHRPLARELQEPRQARRRGRRARS